MVAAIGEVSEETFRPEIHVDDFEVPSEGDSSVRLIHASLDAPAVDVTVAGSDAVLSDNLTFSNASEYVTVPEGTYTLEVRPATDDEPSEAAFDLLAAIDASGEMSDDTMGNETTAEA